LDEKRIELVDCEGIDNMPPYVRFFRALDIPVVALCDSDKPTACQKITAANPDLMIRWHEHRDWEGVLAAEASVEEVASALEECRSTFGDWAEHEHDLRNCVRSTAGDAEHLAEAQDVAALLGGYEEAKQRAALAALLRGGSGLDFKSTIYARQIAQAVPAVPATVAAMIDLMHQFVAGDAQARGVHDL
jgi:hypothetical protein